MKIIIKRQKNFDIPDLMKQANRKMENTRLQLKTAEENRIREDNAEDRKLARINKELMKEKLARWRQLYKQKRLEQHK